MNKTYTNAIKNLIFICSCILVLSACKKEKVPEKENISVVKNTFTIHGTLKNFHPQEVYLNKIIENSIYVIDSSKVKNNTFSFKGFVEYPERFAISFKQYSSTVILIVENADITITIDANDFENTPIEGSKLNSEFKNYQLNSKKIFKKITYLFPQFQKYRLENNANQLADISRQMKEIEQEYVDFSYNYIAQNNNSYIAAIILRDQLKNTKIDTLKIINSYNKLTDSIKKSPDAHIIALTLNLH
ncbi:DUF4369 domain-containing protein [Lutibacter sp. A80]|uniref:DUF4369 domain-containing protein n=1 Tax=Lutibacter sp. A80 TaxID=2918453 RepID=UPI001F056311|nr:DUF4369 domain-containing protein [Lutibacter sp. A80]UMB61332.1 DUF4369 domain-containing protein [Lutibacter sp. A80]